MNKNKRYLEYIEYADKYRKQGNWIMFRSYIITARDFLKKQV